MYSETATLNLVAEDNITKTIDKAKSSIEGLQEKLQTLDYAAKGYTFLKSFSNRNLAQTNTNINNITYAIERTREGLNTYTRVAQVSNRVITEQNTLLGAAVKSFSKFYEILETLGSAAFLVKGFDTIRVGISNVKRELSGFNDTLAVAQKSGVDSAYIQQIDLIKQGIFGSTEAAKQLSINALGAYNNFSKLLAEVQTIANFDPKGLEQFGKQIQDIASNDLKYAVSSMDALAASYQALSAGFSAGGESNRVMVAGLKLAVGGSADASATIELLSKTIRAYNLSANDAALVAAKLNGIVEKGITTIGDLTVGFGQTATVASSAGVKLDDLAASLAQLTNVGFSTSTALTALENLFTKITSGDLDEYLKRINATVTENGEVVRVRFDKSSIAVNGFNKQLERAYVALGRNNQKFLEALGGDTEAYRGAIALVGNNYKQLNDILQDIVKINAEKLENLFNIKIDNDNVLKFTRLLNQISEMLIKIGRSISESGLFEAGMKMLEKYVDQMTYLIDNFGKYLPMLFEAYIGFDRLKGGIGATVDMLFKLGGLWLAFRISTGALLGDLWKTVQALTAFNKVSYAGLSVGDRVDQATQAFKTQGLIADRNVGVFTKVRLVFGQLIGANSLVNAGFVEGEKNTNALADAATKTKGAFGSMGKAARGVLQNLDEMGKTEADKNLDRLNKASEAVKNTWTSITSLRPGTVQRTINNEISKITAPRSSLKPGFAGFLEDAIFDRDRAKTKARDYFKNLGNTLKGEQQGIAGIVNGFIDIIDSPFDPGRRRGRRSAIRREIEQELAEGGIEAASDLGQKIIRNRTIALNRELLKSRLFDFKNSEILKTTSLATKGFTVALGGLGTAVKVLLSPLGLLAGAVLFAGTTLSKAISDHADAARLMEEVSGGAVKGKTYWDRWGEAIGGTSRQLSQVTSGVKDFAKNAYQLAERFLPFIVKPLEWIANRIKDVYTAFQLLMQLNQNNAYEQVFNYVSDVTDQQAKMVDAARRITTDIQAGKYKSKELTDLLSKRGGLTKEENERIAVLKQEELATRLGQEKSAKNQLNIGKEVENQLIQQLALYKKQGKEKTEIYSQTQSYLTELQQENEDLEKQANLLTQLNTIESEREKNRYEFQRRISLQTEKPKAGESVDPVARSLLNQYKSNVKDLQGYSQQINTILTTQAQDFQKITDPKKRQEAIDKALQDNKDLITRFDKSVTDSIDSIKANVEAGFITAAEGRQMLLRDFNADVRKLLSPELIQQLRQYELDLYRSSIDEENGILQQRREIYEAFQNQRVTFTETAFNRIKELENKSIKNSLEKEKETLKQMEQTGAFTRQAIEKQRLLVEKYQQQYYDYELNNINEGFDLKKRLYDYDLELLNEYNNNRLKYSRKYAEQIREIELNLAKLDIQKNEALLAKLPSQIEQQLQDLQDSKTRLLEEEANFTKQLQGETNKETIDKINGQLKGVREDLAQVNRDIEDHPKKAEEITSNAQKQVKISQAKLDTLIVKQNDQRNAERLKLLEDTYNKELALLQTARLKGFDVDKEILEKTLSQEIKMSLEKMKIKQQELQQARKNGADTLTLEAELAQLQLQNIEAQNNKVLGRLKQFADKLTGEADIAAKKVEIEAFVIETQNKLLETQTQLLEQKKNLQASITESVIRDYEYAKETTTSPLRQKQLAKEMLEIRKTALFNQIKLENQIFDIQVKQKELAAEKARLDLEVLEIRRKAELEQAKFNAQQTLMSKDATQEQKQLALLQVEAAQKQLEAVDKEREILAAQEVVDRNAIKIQQYQQQLQQRTAYEQIAKERAALTRNRRDDRELAAKLLERARKEGNIDVSILLGLENIASGGGTLDSREQNNIVDRDRLQKRKTDPALRKAPQSQLSNNQAVNYQQYEQLLSKAPGRQGGFIADPRYFNAQFLDFFISEGKKTNLLDLIPERERNLYKQNNVDNYQNLMGKKDPRSFRGSFIGDPKRFDPQFLDYYYEGRGGDISNIVRPQDRKYYLPDLEPRTKPQQPFDRESSKKDSKSGDRNITINAPIEIIIKSEEQKQEAMKIGEAINNHLLDLVNQVQRKMKNN